MEIFSAKNLKYGKGIEQHQIKIPNMFAALQNLDVCKDINRVLRKYYRECQNFC